MPSLESKLALKVDTHITSVYKVAEGYKQTSITVYLYHVRTQAVLLAKHLAQMLPLPIYTKPPMGSNFKRNRHGYCVCAVLLPPHKGGERGRK